MLISEEWLREWVKTEQDLPQIAYDLTQAGLEIEDIINPATEHLQQVVVAEVLAAEKHPNADRLKLCRVSDGAKEYSIVCGAPNARAKIKVALARIGTVLPGDFKIKESKIRGSLSQGMLCSASELQLGEDHDGIIELPADAKLGKPIQDYVAATSPGMDIAITPNRGDCLSVRGIARDLATLYATKLTPPPLPEIKAEHKDELSIKLEAPDGCAQYLGRIIKGVDLSKPSPAWMQQRLRDTGHNPINIAVDVTNYVMHELGQPLHAFDLTKISGGIVVRYAKPREELTLLDGRVLKLDKDDLLIADHKKPLALAGVMGGEYSGIADDTQDIFLEAAFFNPQVVFGKQLKYNLVTEAAYRFERFVDPTATRQAMERATELLIATAGGTAGEITTAAEPKYLPKARSLDLDLDFVGSFLGFGFEEKEVARILESLGFTCTRKASGAKQAGVQLKVDIPSFRPDIDCAEALCEELARIYGYDKIAQTLPRSSLTPTLGSSESPEAGAMASFSFGSYSEEDKIRDLLAARGFQEVINYSFISSRHAQQLYPDAALIELANPISSDMSVMRPGLVFGLLSALEHNQRHHLRVRKLFEMGLCFRSLTGGATGKSAGVGIDSTAAGKDGSGKDAALDSRILADITQAAEKGGNKEVANIVQENHLGFAVLQPRDHKQGHKFWGEQDYDFANLLADTRSLLNLWGQEDRINIDFTSAGAGSSSALFHPKQHFILSAKQKGGAQELGMAGLLHPLVAERFNLQDFSVFYFSCCLSRLPKDSPPEYATFSRLPPARFELSLVMDENISYAELQRHIYADADKSLVSVELLDIYRSDALGKDKKSMALRLSWQDPAKTLTDAEVNDLVAKLLTQLKSKHEIHLRS